MLTEIDVQATMKAKLDIGLLLTCYLVVAFVDPVAIMQMTNNPDVASVAQELRTRQQRVKVAQGRGKAR